MAEELNGQMYEMLKTDGINKGLRAILEAMSSDGQKVSDEQVKDLYTKLITTIDPGVNGRKKLEEGLTQIGLAGSMDDDDLPSNAL